MPRSPARGKTPNPTRMPPGTTKRWGHLDASPPSTELATPPSAPPPAMGSASRESAAGIPWRMLGGQPGPQVRAGGRDGTGGGCRQTDGRTDGGGERKSMEI